VASQLLVLQFHLCIYLRKNIRRYCHVVDTRTIQHRLYLMEVISTAQLLSSNDAFTLPLTSRIASDGSIYDNSPIRPSRRAGPPLIHIFSRRNRESRLQIGIQKYYHCLKKLIYAARNHVYKVASTLRGFPLVHQPSAVPTSIVKSTCIPLQLFSLSSLLPAGN
jgi:hypothetical protein